MTAKDALELYKRRDTSEKIFLGDKSYLGSIPTAILELDKIEMIKGLDGRYRMDHAVTAMQKTILSVFRMDDKSIRKKANELADMLEKYDKEKQ